MALWIGTSRIGGSWAERNPPVTWPAARYNGLDRGNFVTSRYVGSRPPCIAADFLATMMAGCSDAVIVPREV